MLSKSSNPCYCNQSQLMQNQVLTGHSHIPLLHLLLLCIWCKRVGWQALLLSKETKGGQLNETFWVRTFGIFFYLDLENKTPIEDLWLLIFSSDGIHLSQITQVSTQKPRWPFSQPQGWLFTSEEVDLNLRYTHRVYTVTSM